MNFSEILVDTSRILADAVTERILRNPSELPFLMQLAFSDNGQLAMRASRVAVLLTEKDKRITLKYLPEIAESVQACQGEGLRRHWLKIISLHTLQGNEPYLGKLVDDCFRWLNSATEKPAVKVYCMQILEQVCFLEPDLKGELEESIAAALVYATPGIRVQARKTSAYLKKQHKQ